MPRRGYSAADRAELAELLAPRERLMPFARRVVPQVFPMFDWDERAYLVPLMDKLEACEHGRVRLIANLPPRFGKSVCTMTTLVWLMTLWPGLRHALVGYGSELTESLAKVMLRLAAAAGVRLEQHDAGEWTVAGGGRLYVSSIDGPMVGRGVDGVFVLDDCHKHMRDALSPARQEAVWSYFVSVTQTRLEGDASIVIPMTRWCQGDLTDRILATEKKRAA